MIPNPLSILILLPIIGGALILCTKREDIRLHRSIAIGFSAATCLLAVSLIPRFDLGTADLQFVEKHAWISGFNVFYHVGVDGLSLPLVLVTAFLSLVSIVASGGIRTRTKEYYLWFLTLETGAIGLFAAADLFVFYVFWELVLVPMYFLIGIWGGPRREYAAIKFFLYTLTGSLLMLLAVLAVFFAGPHTLDLVELSRLAAAGQLHLVGAFGAAVFLGFYFAFAIKVPAFPFHTWLPLAHVEAPTPVSVILAGVLLKMGLYGILRICYPILPEITRAFLPVLVVIAAINVVYGAFCALAQTDMKRMVAYSSISHMGLCLLGISAVMGNANAAQAGMSGAVLQMVTHAIITASLFLLVGVVYDRAHTREMASFGGLGATMPLFAGFLMLQAMASLGLPGLAGFVSEFLCLLGGYGGSFADHPYRVWAIVSSLGIVVTAAFLLRMIKLVLMGPPNPAWQGKMPDLSAREIVTVAPLALLTIALGVFPGPALHLVDATVANLVRLVAGA